MPYVNLRLDCTRCGASFQARRPTQAFCSKSCASFARAPKPKPCGVSGCDRIAHARGWCEPHYRRWKRTGSANGRATLAERILRNTRRTEGCWEWIGWLDSKGYGRIKLGRTKSTGAHRASYEMLVGPIPAGMELDHLCENKRCVRPDHLEPVTHAENARRHHARRHDAKRKAS